MDLDPLPGLAAVAVKVAHRSPTARARLLLEAKRLRTLSESLAPLRTPRLFATRDDGRAFARTFVDLPRADTQPLTTWMKPLLLQASLRVDALWNDGVRIDFSPSNIFVDDKHRSLVFVDLGERLAPPVLGQLSPSNLESKWALACQSTASVSQSILPVAPLLHAEAHVEVGLGRLERPQFAWVNRRVLDALPSSDPRGWSALALRNAFAFDVEEDTPSTRFFTATRYQDGPDVSPSSAKGDGRVVHVGASLSRPPSRRQELSLKGCGPTGLQWTDNPFHEDGRVSLGRSLWEASISDELDRLQFQVPRVAAVFENGRSTVDNSGLSLNAATSVRVSETHLRIGHLSRAVTLWKAALETSDSLQVEKAFAHWHHLVETAGQRIHRDDFSVDKVTHVREWALHFAAIFGANVGRTDIWNIHCFNPTLGNILLSGNLIDFSTVRFFRYYAPTFRYMNEGRQVREHRSAFRQFVSVFVKLFEPLIRGRTFIRLRAAALRTFDHAYDQAFLQGLGAYLGAACRGVSHHIGDDVDAAPKIAWPTGATARRLVTLTHKLRSLRSSQTLAYSFWQQRVAAPQFDLGGQLPRFLRAHKRGESEPWRELLTSTHPIASDSPDARLARTWSNALFRHLGNSTIRKLSGRHHDEIIRPTLHLEKLPKYCYPEAYAQRPESEPLAITAPSSVAISSILSSSRRLPTGLYRYDDARRRALQAGHLVVEGLCPLQAEVVIGLTPEIFDALCAVLDERFGDFLGALLAFGPRVVTRSRRDWARAPLDCSSLPPSLAPHRHLRELWTAPQSAPLALTAELKRPLPRSLDAAAFSSQLRQVFSELGAPFRVRCRPQDIFSPQDPTDIPTTAKSVRRRLQSRRDKAWRQGAVILYTVDEGRAPHLLRRIQTCIPVVGTNARQVDIASLELPLIDLDDTGCRLSLHQLENCLRDLHDLRERDEEPSSVPLQPPIGVSSRGPHSVLSGTAVVVAAKSAGYKSVWVNEQPPSDGD